MGPQLPDLDPGNGLCLEWKPEYGLRCIAEALYFPPRRQWYLLPVETCTPPGQVRDIPSYPTARI